MEEYFEQLAKSHLNSWLSQLIFAWHRKIYTWIYLYYKNTILTVI